MDTSLSEQINSRFLQGIHEEPKQLLQPISGYAREPFLPLEEACQPLIPIIPRLEAHVWIAKQNSKNPADGLTQDESAAIRLYTMEWDAGADEPHSSLYSHLNHTLEEIDRINLRPWFRYLKLFLTALAKIPPVPRQTIWRGVRKNHTADYSPGGEITWWAFSSCTASLNVLESDLYLGNTGNRTIFSIEALNGRNIRAHSHFQAEDEILLLPGTYLEVKSRINPAPDLHIIHLQQIIPPHDLLEPPYKDVDFFPSIRYRREKHDKPSVDPTIHKIPWYRKNRVFISAILIALLIILIVVLAVILGTSKKSVKPLSSRMIDISMFNYNISTYSPASSGYVFYSFDGHVLDLYGKHDGTINGSSINYIQGYIGSGQAIVLNQSVSTSIFVSNPFNFTNKDFTFEAFIQLHKHSMTASLIQFSSGMELNIINGRLQMILNRNNIISSTIIISINEWHHIAIVYDLKQSSTSLYINGELNNRLEYFIPKNSDNENTTMIIGSNYDGLIDQFSISLEARTNQRIQWDATVLAFYSLDGYIHDLLLDYGPNYLNATTDKIQFVSGKIHRALGFTIPGSYFQANGFSILNVPQHAFTIALWIRTSMNPGIFLTIGNSECCLLILTIRNNDNHLVAYLPNATASVIGSGIIINRWTHIAFTWSPENQAKLYQDFVLKGTNNNITKLNNGYGNSMSIRLGRYHDNLNCIHNEGLNLTKQFTGSIDEFYVFSRELKQNEIQTLR